jgi:hypothetical protein
MRLDSSGSGHSAIPNPSKHGNEPSRRGISSVDLISASKKDNDSGISLWIYEKAFSEMEKLKSADGLNNYKR